MNAASFQAFLDGGATTDLGGYPVYLVMSDGEALCHPCAVKERAEIVDAIAAQYIMDDWLPVGSGINYEDPDLHCAHCNARIPSAYSED